MAKTVSFTEDELIFIGSVMNLLLVNDNKRVHVSLGELDKKAISSIKRKVGY